MAVVDTEAVERRGEGCDVARHEFPEPRVRRWTVAITQLDTVTPDDNFAPQIRFGGPESEVRKRISSPNPSVVGDRVDLGVRLFQSREVGLDKRVPDARRR